MSYHDFEGNPRLRRNLLIFIQKYRFCRAETSHMNEDVYVWSKLHVKTLTGGGVESFSSVFAHRVGRYYHPGCSIIVGLLRENIPIKVSTCTSGRS